MVRYLATCFFHRKICETNYHLDELRRSTNNGVKNIVGKLVVISEMIFCVESESGMQIVPSRQKLELFEVMYSKDVV